MGFSRDIVNAYQRVLDGDPELVVDANGDVTQTGLATLTKAQKAAERQLTQNHRARCETAMREYNSRRDTLRVDEHHHEILNGRGVLFHVHDSLTGGLPYPVHLVDIPRGLAVCLCGQTDCEHVGAVLCYAYEEVEA